MNNRDIDGVRGGYRHGTRSRYQHAGCRCEPCVAANAAYVAVYKERGANQPDTVAGLGRIDTRPPPGDWVDEAVCRGMNPAMFFPGRGETFVAAEAICRQCPVRMDCLEYGLREPHGVWGGLNEAQRRRLLRRRREWANKNKGKADRRHLTVVSA